MGKNQNIGQDNSLVVFGNPESFKKLIKNHGQLAKIKQSNPCPCIGKNNGSPDIYCSLCKGDGLIFSYQRRFLVTDEDSRSYGNKLYPYWVPVVEVIKAQNVTSEIQGGIEDLEIESFNDTEIVLTGTVSHTQRKRVTYNFDGWTHVESEKLDIDITNGYMYVTSGTVFNAQYQSSNPLNAVSDIAQINKIWNIDSGKEITVYTVENNVIATKEPLVVDKMYIDYYYSDLTQVITADIMTKNNSEVWSHEVASGEVRIALYPFWEISRGDIIMLAATVLYKTELIKHLKTMDKLWEIEIFDLNDTIIDEDGTIYNISTDYILQGRHIRWIGNKPSDEKIISVRYGYKPSFIVFEDNPQPNNLENKQYPKIVFAKSWSKISKNDIAKIMDI
jgi:hypothetical protein